MTVILLLLPIAPAISHADELSGLTLEKEVREMIDRGIIKGFTDGKIYPKADVNRGDFAAFLARTMKLSKETPNFTDINKSSAIAGEVGAMQKSGIMNGTPDGKFLPTQPMTREEMAITTARALAYLGVAVENANVLLTDEASFTSNEGITGSKQVFKAGIMNGIKVNANRTEITFNPKGISQRDQVAAVLKRFIDFVGEDNLGKPGEDLPKPPPIIEPDKFQLATIQNQKIVVLNKTYNTYAEAVNAFNASPTAQGIYKGTELIRVKSGMAFAQGPAGQNTIIYTAPDFKTQATYIMAGREMRILGYDENFMKVQVADTVGYVKHSQIDFVPTAISDAKDYYTALGNVLHHYTYDYLTKSYASYSIGPKPDFMQNNVRYYSADGVHFLDGAGKAVGTHHPYFQFQSVRTKTNYTAAELDAYIRTAIAERESTGIARYAGASTKSKLIGLGTYLKKIEAEQRVNAFFILATAIHESDYGMSANAMTKNNLFGIRVFDSTPEAGEKYATPQRSVEAFVLEYANKNYGPQTGAYSKGAAPGNKTAGFNAHYASDPTWGAKIAGHMWRMDLAMGGKDMGAYNLAMTNQSGNLNVRSGPSTQNAILFSYKPRDLGRSGETGYPIVYVDRQVGSDGYWWYKILADNLRDNNGNPIEYGWIRGDLMTTISQ